MRPRLYLLAAAVTFVMTLGTSPVFADDPGDPDTCRVECLGLTRPNQQVVVEVSVFNDEDLGGLAVPLVFGYPTLDAFCDSVSFLGTRTEIAEYRGAAIDNANYKVVFYAVFVDSHLVAGDGIVANLYFTLGPGWDSTACVQIDTALYPPTTILEFTPRASGQALHPEFQTGCLGSAYLLPLQLVNPPDGGDLCSPEAFDFVWSQAGQDVFYTLQYAEDSNFTTGVVTVTDLEDTTYEVALPRGTYFWHVKVATLCGRELPYQDHPFGFSIFDSGDATNDGLVDLSDVIWILNYLYKNGPEPDPLQSGDANCDGIVDVADAVWLLNYLFKAGSPPCCP